MFNYITITELPKNPKIKNPGVGSPVAVKESVIFHYFNYTAKA